MQGQTDGFAALSKKLNALAEGMDLKVIRRAARSAMLPVAKEAASRVPKSDSAHKTSRGRLVAPGFASRSIKRVAKIDKRRGRVVVKVGVASEAFYVAQFLERGTKYIRPMPWLEPAFAAKQGEVINRFKQQLKKIIDKEARKK
ncbi:MAG: HK97-gp10 family putative phage morphogenesis protein [Candidatus Reddybacter sp.]